MSGRGPSARRPRGRAPATPTRGALRVVAGSLRGRRLDVPAGSSTRPTSDRVRQALFNALESLGAVEGAQVVDPFAGSGALGIEALSRGAAHATFADDDPAALAVVRANVEGLGLAPRARIVGGRGTGVVAAGAGWDLVLLDPPYAFDGWPELLGAVASTLAPDGLVVVESDRDVPLPGELVGVRTKAYGGTVVQFARRSGATS